MTGQGHDYDNPSSGFCAMDDRRDFGPIERSTPSHAFETKAGDPGLYVRVNVIVYLASLFQ